MRYTAVSGAIMLAAGLLIAPYFWTPSALMGAVSRATPHRNQWKGSNFYSVPTQEHESG
jgi:hypothetical protein